MLVLSLFRRPSARLVPVVSARISLQVPAAVLPPSDSWPSEGSALATLGPGRTRNRSLLRHGTSGTTFPGTLD